MKEIDPEVLRRGRILGRQEIQVTVSQLCVNCFPAVKPALFVLAGNGLCQECFIARRKEIDAGPVEQAIAAGVAKRNYKETWKEEPITDAEVL